MQYVFFYNFLRDAESIALIRFKFGIGPKCPKMIFGKLVVFRSFWSLGVIWRSFGGSKLKYCGTQSLDLIRRSLGGSKLKY